MSFTTQYPAKLGLKAIRFSDLDVLKNMDGVLQVLYERCKIPLPPFSGLRTEDSRLKQNKD